MMLPSRAPELPALQWHARVGPPHQQQLKLIPVRYDQIGVPATLMALVQRLKPSILKDFMDRAFQGRDDDHLRAVSALKSPDEHLLREVLDIAALMSTQPGDVAQFAFRRDHITFGLDGLMRFLVIYNPGASPARVSLTADQEADLQTGGVVLWGPIQICANQGLLLIPTGLTILRFNGFERSARLTLAAATSSGSKAKGAKLRGFFWSGVGHGDQVLHSVLVTESSARCHIQYFNTQERTEALKAIQAHTNAVVDRGRQLFAQPDRVRALQLYPAPTDSVFDNKSVMVRAEKQGIHTSASFLRPMLTSSSTISALLPVPGGGVAASTPPPVSDPMDLDEQEKVLHKAAVSANLVPHVVRREAKDDQPARFLLKFRWSSPPSGAPSSSRPLLPPPPSVTHHLCGIVPLVLVDKHAYTIMENGSSEKPGFIFRHYEGQPVIPAALDTFHENFALRHSGGAAMGERVLQASEGAYGQIRPGFPLRHFPLYRAHYLEQYRQRKEKRKLDATNPKPRKANTKRARTEPLPPAEAGQ